MKNKVISFLAFLLLFSAPDVGFASVIHIVDEGDSLWKLSNDYHTSLTKLQMINGLADGHMLVPGQSLVIPGQTYIVRANESLWDIARRHSISIDVLKKHNKLTSSTVHTNQRLSIPPVQKTTISTGSFLVPKDKTSDKWMLQHYKNYITSVGFFEYHPDRSGKLSHLQGEQSIPEAWYTHITPYATIANLSEKGFDHELAHEIVSNVKSRKNLISNIFDVLHQHDLKGVIIDFEGVKPESRNYFNTFIKELTERLHPVGMEVAIAVPPMLGDQYPSWYAGYDYQTLGSYVDFMFLMTYDWHWFGGPSGPVAPITEVKKAVDYAVSVVPRSKLMLGIPMYAYDWVVNAGQQSGKAYSQSEAVKTALAHQSVIHFDQTAHTPWFRYTDKQGLQHEVWFEDARSILAKYRLVKDYNLAGMGGWRLGMEFSQAEHLLLEEFHIRK